MNIEQFMGWRHYTALLENGHQIVCYFFRDKGAHVSFYDLNHNVFRLDSASKVIWQVRRDEQGKLNWDAFNEANKRGENVAELFSDIVLIYADGTNNGNPNTGRPPEVSVWVPGCTVRLRSFSGLPYDLDIDSGIALNVTQGRQRRW